KLAAPLKLLLKTPTQICQISFRGRKLAAPLKPRACFARYASAGAIPRAKARGSVEAGIFGIGFASRDPFRGRKLAAPLKHCLCRGQGRNPPDIPRAKARGSVEAPGCRRSLPTALPSFRGRKLAAP